MIKVTTVQLNNLETDLETPSYLEKLESVLNQIEEKGGTILHITSDESNLIIIYRTEKRRLYD